jgi:GNAT superfamily N-acetyltransferase
MDFEAAKVPLESIESLRALYLQETNFQIRYNARHERAWTDSYLLKSGDTEVGYGSLAGQEIKDRDTIFEFYVLPHFRKYASALFGKLLAASRPKYLECQTNDTQMSAMLYEFSTNISADVVLWEDFAVTEYRIPGAHVRLGRGDDKVFEHHAEPEGAYVLEKDGEILATGGFLLHYNMPFADLYMEVRADSRKKGYGSYLLQEVKKACHEAGRVPAARCGIENQASRATLRKAGLRQCGFMLKGHAKTPRRKEE